MKFMYNDEVRFPGLLKIMQDYHTQPYEVIVNILEARIPNHKWNIDKVGYILGRLGLTNSTGCKAVDRNEADKKRRQEKKGVMSKEKAEKLWSMIPADFKAEKTGELAAATQKVLDETTLENNNLKIQVKQQAGTILNLRAIIDKMNHDKLQG